MPSLAQDLRYALRGMRRSPAFTAVAVLTLALGIGANTAIFSVVDALLLRPLPYPDAGRLVQIEREYQGSRQFAVSYTKFDAWRTRSHSFTEVSASDIFGSGYNLTGGGDPERLRGLRVSSGFFRVLGVPLAVGRDFLPEDDQPGSAKVVIVSDGLWRRRFGADPALIGRSLTLSGEPHTVVGILPPGFRFRVPADLFTPLTLRPSPTDQANLLVLLGRLKPGISVAGAQEEMKTVFAQFGRENPELVGRNESVSVSPWQERMVGDVRPALLVLAGAVAFVLLIACANVANLLLARAASRHREMAVRAAIGATRGRIVAQLLTESALLAVAGGGLGFLAARWTLPALLALAPADLPRLGEISVDLGVLAFTMAVALATGLLFGLAPAFDAARVDLNGALKESARSTSGGSRGRLRGALVVAEVALSLVLLIGAGLLIRTFANLRGTSPGFDTRNVLTANMSMSGGGYRTAPEVTRFYKTMIDRLEALPGVEAAGVITTLPLELGPDLPFEIESEANRPTHNAQWRHVTPHVFHAMRIPVRAGRLITDTDSAGAPAVAVVNEAFARQHFRGRSPLGERVIIGRRMGPEFLDRPREIVGVVGDVREVSLSEPPVPTIYLPAAQVPDILYPLFHSLLPIHWVIRTAVPPMTLAEPVRREMLGVDRAHPAANFRSMEQLLAGSIANQQFNMTLLAVFAGAALLLAVIGIYGVMSYTVAQRSREIAVRMALGAAAGEIVRWVLRRTLVLAGAGIAAGLAVSLALARFLERMLFGVRALDALTFVGVSLALLATALAAAFVPARRATRVDPMLALRGE